jgi:hypothetical protein
MAADVAQYLQQFLGHAWASAVWVSRRIVVVRRFPDRMYLALVEPPCCFELWGGGVVLGLLHRLAPVCLILLFLLLANEM